MNLRDVPDDVYAALADAAAANRQSLSTFVVDRLTEVAQVTKLTEYVASYPPAQESGITLEDAEASITARLTTLRVPLEPPRPRPRG